jgi:hypothetical protein
MRRGRPQAAEAPQLRGDLQRVFAAKRPRPEPVRRTPLAAEARNDTSRGVGAERRGIDRACNCRLVPRRDERRIERPAQPGKGDADRVVMRCDGLDVGRGDARPATGEERG